MDLGRDVPPDQVDFVALDYYLSGIKLETNHYGCIMNIGRCYFHTSRYRNAAKWFDLGIKCDPRCPDAYYCLAASKLKLGDYEGARLTIRKIDVMGATHDADPLASCRRQSRASMRTASASGRGTSNNVSRTQIGMNRNVFEEFKAELIEDLNKSDYYT